MFRVRLVHWARMFNFFTSTMSIVLVHMRAMHVNVKTGPSRNWESISEKRKFERNLAAQRSYNSLLH